VEDALQYINDQFNFIDWVYVIALIFSSFIGLVRKLSAELAGMIISAAVFLGGWKLYGPVSEYLVKFTPNIEDGVTAQVVALLLIIVGIFVVTFLLFRLLKNMLEMALPRGLDHFGGLVAGFFKAAFIICTIIVTISISGHSYLQQHFIEESWFGSLGNKHLPGLYEEYIKQHIPGSDGQEQKSSTTTDA
jgi:uncharacterized membrane protein required for colicin V production